MHDTSTPTSRSRKRPFCIGCAMSLVFVAAWAIYFLHAAESRQWVVGPADPKTGTRIRYQISSRYSRRPPYQAAANNNSIYHQFEYVRRAPPQYVRWLKAHGMYFRGGRASGDGVIVVADIRPLTEGWGSDADGFVDMDARRVTGAITFSVQSEEKRLVGGCPTTVIVLDQKTIVNGKRETVTYLVIHPKGASTSCVFAAYGSKGEKENLDVQELQSIRESVELVGR
jgi:hypothetical protein